MTDMTVATTIQKQLGGARFTIMTGAKNFVGGDNYLQFSIGKNKSRCNKVRVTLKSDDTYTVEFYQFTMPKFDKNGELVGGDKLLKSVDGVYYDTLQEVFTEYTGFYTRL